MRGLSGLLWAGAATLAAPWLRRHGRSRARRGKEIPARLAEREGFATIPRPPGRLLWLHAASVGETLSLLPVLAALPAGALNVLFTTGTLTSADLLARRLAEAPPPLPVLHCFAPRDVPAWVARFLDHWRPDAGALVESELWPNLIFAAAARKIPLFLVNARLSPRSLRGWRRVPGLARRMLGSFTAIWAQSDADAARLRQLGAAASVAGNLKFAAPELPADMAELARLRHLLGGRPVWLAASTHPGEEAMVAAAHRILAATHPDLLTIITPRHPERGADLARELGMPAPLPRRALGEDPPEGGIWLADTLGELGLFYRLAPIVLVGGSLVDHGGQNPLEPARLGCAVAIGPHHHNQADAVAALRDAGALVELADAAALAGFVAAMLADPAARTAMGAAGAAAARGADGLPALLACRLAAAAGVAVGVAA